MRISRLFIALMCAVPATAFAFGLTDDPGPENHVKCAVGLADIDVSSSGDVLTYHIKGTCTVEVPFAKGLWFPAGPYDVVASWQESDGTFNETIKGPQNIGEFVNDPKHGPWQMVLGGICKRDPFMTGADASSCSGRIISSSNALFKFSEKKYPVSPRFVPASVRAGLTGKTIAAIEAEHAPPVILKPEEGKAYTGAQIPFLFGPGKGKRNVIYVLEWQAKQHGNWTKADAFAETIPNPGELPAANLSAASEWRVKARQPLSSKAQWSDWRSFVVGSAPPTPPPCSPAAQFGATYGAAATPATLVLGQTAQVQIKVTNTGSLSWTNAGNFHLSYHWVQNGAVVVLDGQRTVLSQTVSPCESVTVNAALVAPPAAGTYTVQWDMVQEGVAWFSSKGVPTGNRTVTVSASAAPQPPPAKK